jgi:hypothetical protein
MHDPVPGKRDHRQAQCYQPIGSPAGRDRPVTPGRSVKGNRQGKVWRVGFFYYAPRQSAMDSGRYLLFLGSMREPGYVEGKNLVIETRFANGKAVATQLSSW